ncbi:MAG: tetratricopeptide repeat protein [Chitinispirillaceae bacterium]|nr:tetratricopeptide repeat protein [Chitinispirillaceae bacterium]
MNRIASVLIILFPTIAVSQPLTTRKGIKNYSPEGEMVWVNRENYFSELACSLFTVKLPPESALLLDFVGRYGLHFGYSCCFSALPDTFVLLSPHRIYDMCCGDSLTVHRAADALRSRGEQLGGSKRLQHTFKEIGEIFFDSSSFYLLGEMKNYAQEKIIHAAVAYDLFSQISDTTLLQHAIDKRMLRNGNPYILDLNINDLLFNDTLYRKRQFDAFTGGVSLSGNDSLVTMIFYHAYLANDSTWYDCAVKKRFWKFFLAPYRMCHTKKTFLEYCKRPALYDSLNDSEKEFLTSEISGMNRESFIKKYAWRTEAVIDSFAAVLTTDTLQLMLFTTAEYRSVVETFDKLRDICRPVDSTFNESMTVVLKRIEQRIHDSVEISEGIDSTQLLHLSEPESSGTTVNGLPFRQYTFCSDITSLAVHDSVVYAGTDAGLIEIDRTNAVQRYFSPLNSSLKHHRINDVNYWNGTVYIAGGCNELTFFDRKEWRNVSLSDSMSEHFDRIEKVAVAPDGSIWMCCGYSYVCGISTGDTVFINYHNPPFSGKSPSDCMTDKRGSVWFTARNAVLRYREGEWVVFDSTNSPLSGSDCTGLCQDTSGAVWTTCGNVLYRFDGSRWDSLPVPYHPLMQSAITCIRFDKNGTLWIAFTDRIASYDFRTWKLYASLKFNYIRDLVVDKDGAVWLGTAHGLWILDSIGCRKVPTGHSTLPGSITCGVVMDTQGNQWVGGTEGFSVRRSGMWNRVEMPDGIHRLLRDNNDRIIAGSRNGYIYELSDTGATILYHHPDEYDDKFHEIAVDSGGKIRASFNYHCVTIKDSSAFDTVEIGNHDGREVSGILVTRSGEIWVSVNAWNRDSGYVLRYADGTWTIFDEVNSKIKGEDAKVLYEDAKGRVWFSAGYSGVTADLIRFNGNRWKTFDLWYLLGIGCRQVNAVCEDREGRLWVGTDKGLVSHRGRRWSIYPVKEGLWSNEIENVTIGNDDTLWVTSGTAIMAFARQDLQRFSRKPHPISRKVADPDSWYMHAEFCSDPDSGLYYINKAIRLDKNDHSYYVRRAEVYLALQKPEKALIDVERALALGDTSRRGKTLMGEVWLGLGDQKKALEYSSAIIREDTSLTRAYLVRSLAYYNMDEDDSAFADFTRILAREPKVYQDIHAYRARIFIDRQQYDSANACIKRAMALDTASERIFFIKGMLHLRQMQFEDAVQAYTAACRLSPDAIGPVQNRGYCYLQTGNYDLALEDFNKAIRLGNRSGDAYCNRGAAYLRLGDYHKAERDLRHALKLAPDNLSANVNYIALLAGRKQYKEITTFYSTIPETLRKNPKIDAAMGLTCIFLEQYGTALGFLHRAIEADPADLGSYYNVACVHARQGNAPLAIEWLRKAFEKGYRDFEHLDKDNDFNKIRNTEAFLELVGKYRKE